MSDVYYDLYLDTNDGDGDGQKSKFSQIVSFFFKSVFAIIAIGVIGILAYRIITMQEPLMTDDFLANNNTVSAIEAHRADKTAAEYDDYYVDYRTFSTVRLAKYGKSETVELPVKDYGYRGFQVFTQHLVNYYVYNEDTGEYDTVKRSEFYSVEDEDEGNFKISNAYFIPQANQICLTFRYNDNVVKNLEAAYPSSKDVDSPFVVVISDNQGNEYTSYSYIEKDRANYHYQRMIFDGVDFSGVNTLYLDIYYKDDAGIKTPYRNIVIYDANLNLDEVDVKLPKEQTANMKVQTVIRKDNSKGDDEK